VKDSTLSQPRTLDIDEGSSADERENEQDRDFINDGSSESGSGSEAGDAFDAAEDDPEQMTPELIRANREEHRERLAEWEIEEDGIQDLGMDGTEYCGLYRAGVVIYAIPKTDKDEFFQIMAETRHQVKELPNSQPLMRLSFQLTRGTLPQLRYFTKAFKNRFNELELDWEGNPDITALQLHLELAFKNRLGVKKLELTCIEEMPTTPHAQTRYILTDVIVRCATAVEQQRAEDMMRYIAKDVQLSMYADKEQLVALELLSELPQIPYTTLGAQCLDTIAPVNHVSPESLAITGESLQELTIFASAQGETPLSLPMSKSAAGLYEGDPSDPHLEISEALTKHYKEVLSTESNRELESSVQLLITVEKQLVDGKEVTFLYEQTGVDLAALALGMFQRKCNCAHFAPMCIKCLLIRCSTPVPAVASPT
jgi:hypothetical protein